MPQSLAGVHPAPSRWSQFVTLHLLGGALLLALLVVQHETWRGLSARTLVLAGPLRRSVVAVTAMVWLQIALGGWVSTNYAVLACRGFPQCNGQWWPDGMAFAEGFTLLRELGQAGHGGYLSLDALVAIHFVHRVFAVVLVAAIAVLVVALRRRGEPALRRYAVALALLALAQVVSGMSNVVLDWPIGAALAHSGGAAALVAVTTSLLARAFGAAARPAPARVAAA
jgi:cytochrome c oxidase assembly protein subunit 15